MTIAGVFEEMEDIESAEVLFDMALKGFEAELGKEHESTKGCAQNFCLCLKDNDTEKSNATLQALILSYPFLKEIILADTSETDSDYDDTTASLGESSDSEASVGLRSLLYSDDERLSTSFAEGSKISFK